MCEFGNNVMRIVCSALHGLKLKQQTFNIDVAAIISECIEKQLLNSLEIKNL